MEEYKNDPKIAELDQAGIDLCKNLLEDMQAPEEVEAIEEEKEVIATEESSSEGGYAFEKASEKSYTFVFDAKLYDLKPRKPKSPDLDLIEFKKKMKNLKGKKKDVNDYVNAYMNQLLDRANHRETNII